MSNFANGRVDLKLNKSALVERNFSSFYSNFVLNLFIVYELSTWPHNLANNFTPKDCLFGTVKLINKKYRQK